MPSPDRIVRLFKYFATYADLVVTVEGWMGHIAYNLGRPFRLFLAAGSFTFDWFPHGRSRHQQLVAALSPRALAAHGSVGLLRDGDPPPLPHWSRQPLFELALKGLGRTGGPEAMAPLRLALASRDSAVRTWAIAAVASRASAASQSVLLAALDDSAPTVVREAASALLRSGADCRRELGPRYREYLQAHIDIVDGNWDAIRRIGPVALPVLFRIARTGSYVLSGEARTLLRTMLRAHSPGFASRIGERLDRDRVIVSLELPPEPADRPAQSAHEARLEHETVHLPEDIQREHDFLAAILRTSLTDPLSLPPDCLTPIGRLLRQDSLDPALRELALDTLAAVLYARPDLVADEFLDHLAHLARAQPLSDAIGWRLGILFRFLAASPSAPRAWALLDELLRDERLEAGTRARLLPLVEDFVQWREDLVGLDGILALAESPLLESHRAFLLDYGVERFVWSAPESFTPRQLERIAALFATAPRFRYLLYSLAARPGLAPDVRAILARHLDGRFPLHSAAAAVLTVKPVRLLVALNVGQGQGDDVVRLAPLLQALLDANPGLTITLVTWRPYLYDCPRVTPVAIHDDATTQAALAEPFDGILEFFQPGWLDFTFRIELHEAIERVLAARRPAFLLRADLGRAYDDHAGGRSAFVYQTVELNGQNAAETLGLDQFTLRNNYEPCLRLVAELGLPQRAGEESPLTPWLLTGTRSIDAEGVWADLAGEAPGTISRPVALVNPFGGSGRTKGFLEQNATLAAEIEGLVDEGYRVVLLPNGTAWGGPAAITGALEQLEPHVRAHVAVAPDPAETSDAAQLPLLERPELKYADRVVRLFKYFTTYADLVVTVEGWLSHFAYNLGRPFRLFLAAGSFAFDWYPHGRSGRQRLVAALSPRAHAAHSSVGLLRAGDPPPLPHRPRKLLLELALMGLGRSPGKEAVTLLERTLASVDPDIRTWAVAALGRNAAGGQGDVAGEARGPVADGRAGSGRCVATGRRRLQPGARPTLPRAIAGGSRRGATQLGSGGSGWPGRASRALPCRSERVRRGATRREGETPPTAVSVRSWSSRARETRGCGCYRVVVDVGGITGTVVVVNTVVTVTPVTV